jgi:hypothetical protein
MQLPQDLDAAFAAYRRAAFLSRSLATCCGSMVEYARAGNVVLCLRMLGEPAGVHTSGTPERDGLPATARRDPSRCRAIWFLTVAEFDEPAPSRTVEDDRYPGRKRRRFQTVVA